MTNKHTNFIGFTGIVDHVSSRNKDKVIHQDLKETEFDDMVLSVIHQDSEKLAKSIHHNSELLTQYTEYEITQQAEPVMVDQLLRVSFWDEVNTAHAEGRLVSERNIWKGVCSNTYWNRVRDELSLKMAYVLCPLMSYSKAQKLGLQLGQRAMIDILNANPNQGGKYNTKLAALQHQVYQGLQDRAYGKAVQRIQTHNTNESVKGGETIEDLQKEIAELEAGKIVTIEPSHEG